jgi:hypothetical protein
MVMMADISLRIVILEAFVGNGTYTEVQINQLSGAAGILANAACMMSKTAVVMSFLRLVQGWPRYCLWFIAASMNLITLVTIILLFAQCTPVEKNWDHSVPGSCWDLSYTLKFGFFAAGKSTAQGLSWPKLTLCRITKYIRRPWISLYPLSLGSWCGRFVFAFERRSVSALL